MVLGIVRVQCRLNGPPQRTHYGSEDAVTGRIILTYTPNVDAGPSNELFGPLEIDLTFEGTFRILRERWEKKTRTLFRDQQKLFNGSLRFEPQVKHEFPFSCQFPDVADSKQHIKLTASHDDTGQWTMHRERAPYACEEPLPPSLHSSDSHVVTGITNNEIIVQYTLGFDVSMPGIDVDIAKPNAPIHLSYNHPKVPAAAAAAQAITNGFSRELTIRSDNLIPEDARPRGVLGKTKALMKSTDAPTHAFNMTCRGIPEHVYIQQPVTFTVSIRSDAEKSTASVVPDVVLKSCVVSLVARTSVQQESGDSLESLKMPDHLETLKTKECDIVPSGPFAKIHDYTKTVDVGILDQVPSSFENSDMGRSYWLRLVMSLTAAEETLTVTRQFAVVVHPPLLLQDNGRMPYDVPPNDDEALPAYEEVIAGPST